MHLILCFLFRVLRKISMQFCVWQRMLLDLYPPGPMTSIFCILESMQHCPTELFFSWYEWEEIERNMHRTVSYLCFLNLIITFSHTSHSNNYFFFFLFWQCYMKYFFLQVAMQRSQQQNIGGCNRHVTCCNWLCNVANCRECRRLFNLLWIFRCLASWRGVLQLFRMLWGKFPCVTGPLAW